jgi:hypothetical protein
VAEPTLPPPADDQYEDARGGMRPPRRLIFVNVGGDGSDVGHRGHPKKEASTASMASMATDSGGCGRRRRGQVTHAKKKLDRRKIKVKIPKFQFLYSLSLETENNYRRRSLMFFFLDGNSS